MTGLIIGDNVLKNHIQTFKEIFMPPI